MFNIVPLKNKIGKTLAFPIDYNMEQLIVNTNLYSMPKAGVYNFIKHLLLSVFIFNKTKSIFSVIKYLTENTGVTFDLVTAGMLETIILHLSYLYNYYNVERLLGFEFKNNIIIVNYE